tara:strand:+ start:733 stop:1002 length:270 start_codon:yes stop_codon:yes gene_type:complete
MSNKLVDFRNQIDDIDNQILNLLVNRFEIVKKVGEYKKQNNVIVSHPNRENDILSRLKSQDPNSEELIELVWGDMFKYSCNLQNKMNKI